jgi:hypothetical protein
MSEIAVIQQYISSLLSVLAGRVVDDERGSATAEQIVMIAAAVVGAIAVSVVIWQKMQDGADSVQTPTP